MDFSVLEITDSKFNILSSGHFVANAGNSITEKAKLNNELRALMIIFWDIIGSHYRPR
jgi:hypothetical protein